MKNNAGPVFDRLRGGAPAAIARAVNRAAVSARAAMLPPMSKDLGTTQALLREGKYAVRLRQASPTDPVARLSARAAGIPLIDAGAKGPEPSRGKGRGVSARGRRFPHGFIATMKSGHRGAFERRTKKRLPIRELRTELISRVFDRYRNVGEARGLDALAKNLISEFKYLVSNSRQ